MRRSAAAICLLLLAAACASERAPERGTVIRVLPESGYAVGDRDVSGEELEEMFPIADIEDSLTQRVVVEAPADADPDRVWHALRTATRVSSSNIVLRLSDGSESSIPLEVGHLCRAVEFYDGGESFGGHERVWNYVFVDVAIDAAGRAEVSIVWDDDRRSDPPEDAALPAGWKDGAPEVEAPPDAAVIRDFFASFPAGEVEPLVRVKYHPQTPLVSLVRLLNELRAAVGRRVMLGWDEGIVLDNE